MQNQTTYFIDEGFSFFMVRLLLSWRLFCTEHGICTNKHKNKKVKTLSKLETNLKINKQGLSCAKVRLALASFIQL